MCEDMNWKIWVIAAEELKYIFPLCSEDSKFWETFVEELVELVNDEDSFVKVEALMSFSEIIQCISAEDLKSKFVSIIKE